MAATMAGKFWPVGLAIYYPHPTAPGQTPHAVLEVVAALAALLALTAGAVFAFRRGQRAVLVGWLFFVGVLVPMIGLVQVGHAGHADRYMYVPLVGLAIAVVFPIADWVRARPPLARGAVALGLLVCGVWSVVSYRQTALWRDARSLFEHTLAHTTRNALVHYNLGNWLQERGEAEAAQQHFQAAREIDPAHVGAAVNLGLLRFLDGDREAGIELLEVVLRAEPDHARGNLNLAVALVQQGEYDRAWQHLQRAKHSDSPDDRDERLRAHRMLPELAALRGDSAGVVTHYEAALAFAPDDLEILRGAALRFANATDPSVRRRSLELARRLVERDKEQPALALERRALAELANGDRQAAAASLQAALLAADPADDRLRARLRERQRRLPSPP